MNHDPLLHHISLIARRILLFFMLSAAQAIVLWLWLYLNFNDWTFIETVRHMANVWPLSLDVFASVMGMAAVWIGVADTAVLYLLLGRWWKRRADVLHQRGSRFIDAREEQ
ncbi:MAG: hypothetical protein WC073_13570 [Sterolibacterium sp.]